MRTPRTCKARSTTRARTRPIISRPLRTTRKRSSSIRATRARGPAFRSEWTSYAQQNLEGDAAQKAYAEARKAADKAVALQPDLAAAYTARATLKRNADFDWVGAEADSRRAVELAPDDGGAKFSLGVSLATFGKPQEAIALTTPGDRDQSSARFVAHVARGISMLRSAASTKPKLRSANRSRCNRMAPATTSF